MLLIYVYVYTHNIYIFTCMNSWCVFAIIWLYILIDIGGLHVSWLCGSESHQCSIQLDIDEIPLSDAGIKFYCRNCGREGHRRYYCPELKDSLTDRRFRCRMCGEKGHNRRTCPKSSLSNQKNTVRRHHRCKICHRRGHNRRTCPKIVGTKLRSSDASKGIPSSGRRRYKCRLCRQTGHNIRTCPNATKRNVSASLENDILKKETNEHFVH